MEKNAENKVSLLKDIEMASKKGVQPDERVLAEKNKIMSVAYNVLILVLVVAAILNDIFEVVVGSEYIFGVIGMISYTMLLAFCKKAIIKGNNDAPAVFIWSILTFPISIFNIIANYINSDELAQTTVGSILMIVLPIFIVFLVPVILYRIANIIYKKAIKAE